MLRTKCCLQWECQGQMSWDNLHTVVLFPGRARLSVNSPCHKLFSAYYLSSIHQICSLQCLSIQKSYRTICMCYTVKLDCYMYQIIKERYSTAWNYFRYLGSLKAENILYEVYESDFYSRLNAKVNTTGGDPFPFPTKSCSWIPGGASNHDNCPLSSKEGKGQYSILY